MWHMREADGMGSLESRKEPEKEARAPDNAGTDCGSDELSQDPNGNELLFELSFFCDGHDTAH